MAQNGTYFIKGDTHILCDLELFLFVSMAVPSTAAEDRALLSIFYAPASFPRASCIQALRMGVPTLI